MRSEHLRVRSQTVLFGVLLLLIAVNASHKGAAADSTELFLKSCGPCHGKNGKAETPAAKKLGVKDLSLSKLTDAEIAEQIREGKADKQGQSKMPAFKEKLSDEQIKSIVAVVKSFRK